MCAWCGKRLKHVKMANSHGICPSCRERLLREWKTKYAREKRKSK